MLELYKKIIMCFLLFSLSWLSHANDEKLSIDSNIKKKQNVFVPVVVIHGEDRQLYLEVANDPIRIPLEKLAKNIYAQPNFFIDKPFRYCTDEFEPSATESFWRSPSSSPENHVYSKESIDIEAPKLPKTLDVVMSNPELRAPKSELFDDSMVSSFILYSDGGIESESDEYTTGVISFISKTETHIELPGKFKWAGESSSIFEPHNYKINFKDDLNGIPLVYAKKSHFDRYGIQEKIARDIANAMGYVDLRSSYTYLTVNGVNHGVYPLLERYTDSNMSSFIGHSTDNADEPGSYVYAEQVKMGVDSTTGSYEINFQNPNKEDIEYLVTEKIPNKLSDPSISYDEFSKLYDVETLARAMATNVLLNNTDSFFKANHNFYYAQEYNSERIAMYMWDFETSLQFSMKPNEIPTSSSPSEVPPEVTWAMRYPEFVNRYHEILYLAYNSGIFNLNHSNIVSRANAYNKFVVENDNYPRMLGVDVKDSYVYIIPETLRNLDAYLNSKLGH